MKLKRFDYCCLIYTVLLLVFGFDDEGKEPSVTEKRQTQRTVVSTSTQDERTSGTLVAHRSDDPPKRTGILRDF